MRHKVEIISCDMCGEKVELPVQPKGENNKLPAGWIGAALKTGPHTQKSATWCNTRCAVRGIQRWEKEE